MGQAVTLGGACSGQRPGEAQCCAAPRDPKGQPGRPSKALAPAEAVLAAAERSPPRAYVVVSLLAGPGTEELRALGWNHTDLEGDPDADPPVPPYIMVW